VLAYQNFDQQFILTTDASKVAVAAVLSQAQNGTERPIAYASRQMNKAEQAYSASEAELLAVAWAAKERKKKHDIRGFPHTQNNINVTRTC
jgi:hypothetical protein